jgi:hypothetical protein
MKVKEFKQRTMHLDRRTKVLVAKDNLEQVNKNPYYADVYELLPQGELLGRYSSDVADAPTIEDFHQMCEESVISIDKKDGKEFADAETMIIVSACVILA